MREIKLRGKRIDNGEWLYGDLVQADGSNVVGKEHYIYPKDALDSPDNYLVDPETIGQFTGRKDHSAQPVEIYSGDRVEVETSGIGGIRKHPDGIYTVVWDEIGCGFVLENEEGTAVMQFDECTTYNVVGNIHES